ncbi:MAG: VCBS repeat-containing protein [Streptomyces turgidiscabies]|nr:VCBS repeat-containing protein [Streptomyces turgidiscabies]
MSQNHQANRGRRSSRYVVTVVAAAIALFAAQGTASATIPSFASHVEYGTGASPVAVKVGDFDEDGHLDQAVNNQADNTVSILLGNGDGTFDTHVDYAVGSIPDGLEIADFDKDGHLDLVSVSADANTVSILLGNGDGTFDTHVDYGAGTYAVKVAVADFDGDTNLDLAVTNVLDSTVSILLGNGDGTFDTHVDYGVGTWPYGVVVGDFDKDTNLDLAVTNVQGRHQHRPGHRQPGRRLGVGAAGQRRRHVRLESRLRNRPRPAVDRRCRLRRRFGR